MTSKAAHVVPVLLLSTLAALTPDTWAAERASVDAPRAGEVAGAPLVTRLPARLTAATAAMFGLTVPEHDGSQSMAVCAHWARRGLRQLALSLSVSTAGPELEPSTWATTREIHSDKRLAALRTARCRNASAQRHTEQRRDYGRAPPRA